MRKDPQGKPVRFSSLKTVYALHILNYRLFQGDGRAFRIFESLDTKTHEQHPARPLIEGYLELTKHTFETENQKHWQQFFQTGQARMDAPDYIRTAAEIIKFSNLRREEQEMATALERAEDDYQAVIYTAYLDGKDEGKEIGKGEGLREGKREIILNMRRENFPDETIARITGYSLEEIAEIIE